MEGYLQIIRRGPWRGWLVHRKVMYEACREMCYYPFNGNLPAGFIVEHLDHNRQHNCIENLMLLDKRIHDAITLDHWYRIGKPLMESRIQDELGVMAEVEMPDWVTSNDC